MLFSGINSRSCARVYQHRSIHPQLTTSRLTLTPFFGARHREVYLPAGTVWSDAWSGEVFNGGQFIIAEAPLARIPLYLRAGARLPIRDEMPDEVSCQRI